MLIEMKFYLILHAELVLIRLIFTVKLAPSWNGHFPVNFTCKII